jgi:peptidoglycan/xylan/chitin deacetylase (PgdA/CDA1 family)
MYHEISPAPDARFLEYTVTPDAFETQMRWLARAGYRTITTDELAGARRGERSLPERPVLITFDDGFDAALRHAPAILARHGFRAMLYVVTGLAGQPSRWMVPEVGVELPLTDWSAVRAAERDGFRCGSHSVTHPRLARIAPDACRRELTESRRTLEDVLGREVTDLAYPFGNHDDRVVEAAAECGYVTGVTTEGCFSHREPLLRLRRLAVTGFDTMRDFRLRVLTGRSPAEWWDEVRKQLGLPERKRRR